MRDYIIMTDSCCDLNAHMAQELELNVVPLTVHMNGKDYANMLDGSEISFEEFYKNIRSGILSTTSAANVGQFEDAMRAVLAQGKDIVCINFSSALSATYQNACIAAKTMADEFPESHVYVVDSLSASLGQGLLLYLAVQKKREGLSADELVQWVEENIPFSGEVKMQGAEAEMIPAIGMKLVHREIEEKPDYIILDPPRDGIHPKAIGKIIDYGVENMVYISCKPSSLARDLEIFAARGYEVKKICCVDMFPNTYHIETVVGLHRKDM